MSLVWTLPTEKAKNAVKNLSSDELAEELNYNLNKVHTSSPLIDGINSSVGLLLRPFRDVDETAITSLPPPKGQEIAKGNFGAFNFPKKNRQYFPMSLSIGQFLTALFMLRSKLHIGLVYIKAYVGWLHGFGSLFIM